MRQTIIGFTLGIATMATLFLLLSNHPADGHISSEMPNISSTDRVLPQIVKPPQLADAYSFANEALDMQNDDVRERLERELLRNVYFQSNTLLLIKRSARFFPTIERILAEEGLPDDLKYLAVAESGLEPVKSPAGAKGYWQFMPAVGKAYQLEINTDVDERNHLEKATRAACGLLRNYRQQFGNWHLAAAAYNMGEGNVRKYLREQQAEHYTDFNINQETMQYLFRIVAIKSIMEAPRDFGFYVEANEHYAPLENYSTEVITTSLPSLADFAKEKGISYRQLKRYNPWLIGDKLSVLSGKSYVLKIPN